MYVNKAVDEWGSRPKLDHGKAIAAIKHETVVVRHMQLHLSYCRRPSFQASPSLVPLFWRWRQDRIMFGKRWKMSNWGDLLYGDAATTELLFSLLHPWLHLFAINVSHSLIFLQARDWFEHYGINNSETMLNSHWAWWDPILYSPNRYKSLPFVVGQVKWGDWNGLEWILRQKIQRFCSIGAFFCNILSCICWDAKYDLMVLPLLLSCTSHYSNIMSSESNSILGCTYLPSTFPIH